MQKERRKHLIDVYWFIFTKPFNKTDLKIVRATTNLIGGGRWWKKVRVVAAVLRHFDVRAVAVEVNKTVSDKRKTITFLNLRIDGGGVRLRAIHR